MGSFVGCLVGSEFLFHSQVERKITANKYKTNLHFHRGLLAYVFSTTNVSRRFDETRVKFLPLPFASGEEGGHKSQTRLVFKNTYGDASHVRAAGERRRLLITS